MSTQLQEAFIEKVPVTPYPEFIKQELSKGLIDASKPNRRHLVDFLESYDAGCPAPPRAYYAKIKAKDDLTKILTKTQQLQFESILGE